ncbi:hypothetical protein [Pseudoalteromonas sp. McH1-42]|uniref:hypothetical protein n=1 Tax=Pseudoalteromonas sp. McH1-42 TaxID=2917752 RepID=UPI001EF66B00|nr:hypothetical protein [Pseudoalteromonas sp. McH1-42]MCG7561290.1 hypothetical protein [Pseudoalteromonas sp. McH1-42]
MLNFKVILLLLLMVGSFTVIQTLDRPQNDIFVTEEELGMSFEDQAFFNEKQAQQYLNDIHDKREALLNAKLIERKERLSYLKYHSLILVLVSLLTVFIVSSESSRVLYAIFLLVFSLIEWWRFSLSGLVLALGLISIIQLAFYVYKDKELPPDWDKNIKRKKDDEN